MKAQVIIVLLAVALLVGAGVVFFANTAIGKTTLPLGESKAVRCVLGRFAVFEVATVQNSTTAFGSATFTTNLETYQTTTSDILTVGFVAVSTSTYTGTITGALAEGNYTACSYISG